MFGANVKSVYILNMPLQYHASLVAVIAMVVHQFIRFFMGVHAMEESMYNGLRQNRSGNHNIYIRIILKGVVVTIIVPLSILVPAYGKFSRSPLMAFLGSFLGIVVSFIIRRALCHEKRKANESRIRDVSSYNDNSFGNFRGNCWYGEQLPSNDGAAMGLC
ncbi:vacuolar amino acid transporter 1 [Tanacetum coccineum]